MNIYLRENPHDQISKFLGYIQQSARIKILLIIDQSETCVCHIESILGIRQAAISQHLMSLRKAGLVTTRRQGRHIYYRLNNPEILVLLFQIGHSLGISESAMKQYSLRPYPGCSCPQCKPGPEHDQVC